MKRLEFLEFTGDPQRLDSFLAREFHEFSRGFLKKLILDGAVTVDNVKRKPAWPLASGNRIHIIWPEPRPCASLPSKEKSRIEPWILHEDEDILAISKPSGLMVHPLSPSWERAYDASFAGEPTLVSWLLSAHPEIASSGVKRMGLVHRLDRGTSGVMLVVKTPRAQEKLLTQFRERKIEKTYTGVVHGEIEKDSGIIEAPTSRIAGAKKITVSGIGKYTATEFSVVLRKKGYTLLELYPKTGRTNQIRVHLLWIGHPVVGDSLYHGKPRKQRAGLPLPDKSADGGLPRKQPFASGKGLRLPDDSKDGRLPSASGPKGRECFASSEGPVTARDCCADCSGPDKSADAGQRAGPPASRLMLHSKKIVFAHPATGKKTSVESPLPDDFKKEWEKLTA